MRAENKDGRGRRVFIPFLARWVSPVFAIAIGFYLGAQGPAYSQIEGRKISAPSFSGSSSPSSSTTPLIPKAPQQVEMPTPPPTKIFPGLEEPLVATGPVSEAENKDLDAALKSFHDAPAKAGPGGDYDDYSKPLLAFIAQHPESNWNAALYTNIGFGYYRAGYYSRVFTYLDKAWQLGRNATSPQAHMMIDRAVGELAKMHARIGNAEELEALLKDIGKRPIGGPATETIQGAREGLWTFHHNPGVAYMCGPAALRSMLVEMKYDPKKLKPIADAHSGPHGYSLEQLGQLADKTKVKYTLIHREPGQPIPAPSVINWKVHHYAAVTSTDGTLYKVADPTFGSPAGAMLTPKAIDAEGSGYFLVPDSVMKKNAKAGWRIVAEHSAEAKTVYGMGMTSSTPPGNPTCNDKNMKGMTVCNAKSMVVSLTLSDTPLGYTPQKGQPVHATLVYNSREASQPATMSYSNVGPKWTLSLLSFMNFTPTNGYSYPISYIPGGGGAFAFANIDGYTGQYLPSEDWNGAITTRNPIGGGTPTFTRNLADGTVEHYTLGNGATTAPAFEFLTSSVDPRGNTTTYNYDSSFRLTSIVDAMGRSMTFTYGLTAYPLLITKVTDPFGRTTQLTYDTSQRLSTITDPVGITSSFTYSAGDPTFVSSLTTPYGTSNYNETPNPNDTVETNTRALTLTDPLGYTDYLYFYQNSTIVPATDASAIVPTGMTTNGNGLLEWRNTFYWDKHAFALGATMTSGQVTAQDFTKAMFTHWAHYAYYVYWTGDTPESIKRPLENRVWYNYPQQTDAYYAGSINNPSATGRVLDDGTTQLSLATYNTTFSYPPLPGNKLSTTDEVGRATQFTYATNNIDLLTVKQLTAPSTYTTIATYGSYTSGHQPQTYTDTAGQVWHYAYNAAGQISTATDPNSGITTYNYDTSGRLSSIVNANSVTQATYTYDSADRIQTYTDSQGYVLTYAYDNLDRVTSITYPDGTTDLYDYTFQSGPYVGTPSLELRKQTDRLGRVTTYSYDADQRLTSVTEPTSGTGTRTTQYDYYENGALKDIVDANGNNTHWNIDIESRPTSKTYAYGTSSAQTETYTYENTTSRLKSITDALGQVKTFTYAHDNRITGITYTSTVNPTPNVTFAYDTYFPRLTSMTDGTGTTNYSYTAIGTDGALKLSSIAGPYSNDTIGLTYDALGRLSGRNITGGNETFGYDPTSRLTSHGTPLGSFTEGYLGQTNQQTSQSVTNGSTTVSTGWGYDTNTNDRRLIGITNSGVSRSFTIGYGSGPVNVYDIMSITDTAATGHPWATQSRAYTYDLIDRLLTASSTTPGNDTYAYDNLDNATTYNTPASGSLTPTYNVLNQLATFGSNTYSYDANGNTTGGDGVKTYKYNAENRLIEIDYVGTSNKSVFAYDGLGHRISDAETVSGTTTTTYYLLCPTAGTLSGGGLVPDGLSQAAGGTLCQTRDGSQTVIRRDLPEGEYNVTSGQKLIYMPDQLGSVRDVIDGTTGNLVQSYDYTPYGAVARSNGSTPTDFQYAGLMNHSASGLLMSITRFFDPVSGRWINRDPIRERGGINLYAYASANPAMLTDPDGTLSLKKWAQIIICIYQLWDYNNNPGDRIGKYTKLPTSGQQAQQTVNDCGDYCKRLIREVVGAGSGATGGGNPPVEPPVPARPWYWFFIIPPAAYQQLWQAIGGEDGAAVGFTLTGKR